METVMVCCVHWTLSYILLGCQLEGKKSPPERWPWASLCFLYCLSRLACSLSTSHLTSLPERKSPAMPTSFLPVHPTGLLERKVSKVWALLLERYFSPHWKAEHCPRSSTNKMPQSSALHSCGLAVRCLLAPWKEALISTCQKRQSLVQKAGLLRILVTVLNHRTKASGSAQCNRQLSRGHCF